MKRQMLVLISEKKIDSRAFTQTCNISSWPSSSQFDSMRRLKTKSAELLSQIYGMDTAIINELMYGIREINGDYRDGYVKNMESEERWSWRKSFLERSSKKKTHVLPWCGDKIGELITIILFQF